MSGVIPLCRNSNLCLQARKTKKPEEPLAALQGKHVVHIGVFRV